MWIGAYRHSERGVLFSTSEVAFASFGDLCIPQQDPWKEHKPD